jgi:putative hemolysin
MLETAFAPPKAPAPATRLAATPPAEPVLRVEWARSLEQVREAQRLRHLVFAGELGATLDAPLDAPAGHDVDDFDPFCEHLLVRAAGSAAAPTVVGTYRVLTPDAARRAGGLYSDREFDLSNLQPLRRHLAELGRSCVHPAWRHGGVILALWGALAEFMVRHGVPAVIGCASVDLRDGGHRAASLWRRFEREHPVDQAVRVEPRHPLPVDDLRGDLPVEPPALIKGYLRCGARVIGPPAWDPAFNTADFPMLLRLADLPPRYRRHLLGSLA